MTISNIIALDQFDCEIRKVYKDNELMSSEGSNVIFNAYARALTTDFKLLKKSEVIKELGLSSQKELSRLISRHDISTIQIAGHIRVPSWSIFLYKHRKAFNLDENERKAIIGAWKEDEEIDAGYFDDLYDEDAFALFVDEFGTAAGAFFYNKSADGEYYSLYDLMKILRLPPNIVFKIIGTDYLKPIFRRDEIYFCPNEVYRFLEMLMNDKDIIFV